MVVSWGVCCRRFGSGRVLECWGYLGSVYAFGDHWCVFIQVILKLMHRTFNKKCVKILEKIYLSISVAGLCAKLMYDSNAVCQVGSLRT